MIARELLGTSAVAIALSLAHAAHAQDTMANGGGLEEIIVTAQKREQSLQDVPVAVTAVTAENLQANRIFNVNDLSSIAPGLTVKASPGGVGVPAFTMRGQVSFGVVAGSDKQVSIYVDGVYVSSPRGSIFDLPDIQRLEVLRGPQGTLFGRNATAGAISVTTRDPSGEARMRAEGSVGNQGAYRTRLTLETPQFGPFSAYFTYVRNYRRGDVRNVNSGLLWDRSLSGTKGVSKSANWLGTADSDSYFAAVKFEPSDTFSMVYKFDRNDDSGTPDASVFAGNDLTYEPQPGFGLGKFLDVLYSSNNIGVVTNGRRPETASNGWTIPREQRVQGHSLVSTWTVSDNIILKNTLAHRKAYIFSPTPIDGGAGLTLTPAALQEFAIQNINRSVGIADFYNTLPAPAQAGALAATLDGLSSAGIVAGNRVVVVATQPEAYAKQWSDELQLNYTGDNLNVTLGALWFHSKDEAGGPSRMRNTPALLFVPASGLIPSGNEGRYFNKATSLAAYAQLEYKLTPEFELVAGARITHDKKTSVFRWDSNGVPQTPIVPPTYKKTKPNYLLGLNWTPSRDTLVYAKYSTSFVSGGSVGGIEFKPETATSWEAGLKADLFDRKLRTNLAVYRAVYNHLQNPSTTTNPGAVGAITQTLTDLYGSELASKLLGSLSLFVNDIGKMRAQGFELEATAAPASGVTVGGSVGYTDTKLLRVPPNVLSGNGGVYLLTQRPEWTASVFGSYETEPLVGDATMNLRLDGQYRSSIRWMSNPDREIFPSGSNSFYNVIPGYWVVNSRAALRHIKVGPGEAELAVWAKNLTDRRDAVALTTSPLGTQVNFIQGRSYGLELSVEF